MDPLDAERPVREVARRNPPLTTRQRLAAVGLALATVASVALATTVLVLVVGGSRGDVVWSALVYGGLLASAVVVVYVDRSYAGRCPRCGRPGTVVAERRRRPGPAGATTWRATACAHCGYDLERRPRYGCTEHERGSDEHPVFLDPGLCDCGRRLHPVAVQHGPHREVTLALRVGGLILAFLLGVGLLLRLFDL